MAVQVFSSRREQGLLFVVVHGVLVSVASLAAEHRLWVHGFQEFCCLGLVVPQHVDSSWIRDRTCVPCIGRQILNH